MISEADIANALTDHLAGMSDLPPVAWPNKDLPTGTGYPYLVVQLVRVSRQDRTLKGGHANSRGFMLVTGVDQVDEWETTLERLADRVSERFSYPRSLSVTGGRVTITKPPELQRGYRDGPRWRLPVRIDYLAH
jgi:hypothetical protein